jgi:hypothetical protein
MGTSLHNLVPHLQESILNSLLENQQLLNLSQEKLTDFSELIADPALLVRFIKKHKSVLHDAQLAIMGHLDWRVENQIGSIDLSDPCIGGGNNYFQKGIFRFGKVDLLGRPLICISPALYSPSSRNRISELTSNLTACFEAVRRWIATMQNPGVYNEYQAVAIIDLTGFGFSQMDFDLIPVVYDIFKKHYPQILGQVLVLNYGWVHGGIWQIISTMLTEEAKKKLVFVDKKHLLRYIPPENIPKGYL